MQTELDLVVVRRFQWTHDDTHWPHHSRARARITKTWMKMIEDTHREAEPRWKTTNGWNWVEIFGHSDRWNDWEEYPWGRGKEERESLDHPWLFYCSFGFGFFWAIEGILKIESVGKIVLEHAGQLLVSSQDIESYFCRSRWIISP